MSPFAAANFRPSSPPISALEASRLKTSTFELEGLLSELQEFCRGAISDDSESSKPKVKRLKWVWNRRKATQLQERARAIRVDLQLALTTFLSKRQQQQRIIMLDVRDISHSSLSLLSQIDSGVREVRHLLQLTASQDSDRLHLSSSSADPSGIPSLSTDSDEMSPSNVPDGFNTVGTREDDCVSDESIKITASLFDQCPSSCSCQCHRVTTARSPTWFTPVLGAMMVNYNTIPVVRPRKCDHHRCKRASSSISLTYRFPSWLCGYYISLKASLDSVVGYGAYVHVTVPRSIALNDRGYFYLSEDVRTDLSLRYFSENVHYSPRDEFMGGSLLTRAIMHTPVEVLEMLLTLWAPLLRRNGLTREERFSIYTILDLPWENQRHHTVKRALSFDTEPVYDAAATDIHRAIIDGNIVQLEKAICEQPREINRLNHRGWAPIHLAVNQRNVHALQLLIRHGADINMRDGLWRETPLHIAVRERSLNCVQVLVRAGCAVDLVDYNGFMPIHEMIELNFRNSMASLDLEIIEALVRRCPSLATCKDKKGQTIIWGLVMREMDLSTFRSLLSLLIDLRAWTELDEDTLANFLADGFFWGISSEKLRMLGEAGLSLEGVIQSDRSNILHHLFLRQTRPCSEHEMIDYLRTRNLKVDTELHNAKENTPWDCLRFTMTCDEINLTGRDRPSREEVHNFALLFSEVRDRNLQQELEFLDLILESLYVMDSEEAMKRLAPLLKWKQAWNREEEAETYRIVSLQIKENMWEAAIEAVQENIETCLEEMGSSPWNRKSRYDVGGEKEDYAGVREQFELIVGNKGCPLLNPNWRCKRRRRPGRFARKLSGLRVVRLLLSNKLRRCWTLRSRAVIVPRWL
ncbi:hypothetical protein QBC42DRAFT_91907 [Cladorrhinum samala]|uniref:Ankyrin n=1 Tax=Cladorrhinum samala TaxID=585594 RepID=A0AAV9HMK0_9PEZI|nr:hypothetical protein QBC42DRAFT_91907 [Cladorrhinum samala]